MKPQSKPTVIIHCDKFYPSTEACANRMEPFALRLAESGYEVTVLTSSTCLQEDGISTIPVEDAMPTIHVIYCDTASIDKNKTVLKRVQNNLSFKKSSIKAADCIDGVDIVLASTPPVFAASAAGKIARKHHAKFVLDVRDIWPDVAVEIGSFTENSIYYRVFNRISKRLYRQADLITTVSPGKIEKLDKKLDDLGLDNAKVAYMPNGLDERFLNLSGNPEIVRRFHMDRRPTCSYIGNIGLAQGLGALLDLAESSKAGRYSDVQFLIFGNGAEMSTLQKMAEERELTNVMFPGRISKGDVAEVLRNSSFAYVSLKNGKMKDSIPTKLFEAIGVGCPVLLVADGDSCRVLDESGLGIHVSPGNPQALTAAFVQMLDNRHVWENHKQAAMKLIREKYSRQVIAQQLESNLDSLLRTGR